MSLVAWLWAGPALARAVFLNGVKVDGLANQVFEKCRVRFDANGDVHIDVQGVKVQVVQQEGVVPAALAVRTGPALAERYFLDVAQRQLGLAQYDIEVVINGRPAARFRSDVPGSPVDVTAYLRPGTNTVLFVANKQLRGGRRSSSPQDYMRVSLVRGTVQGERVYVKGTVTSFQRTAADLSTGAEERRVNVR